MKTREDLLLLNQVRDGSKESYKKVFDLYYHELYKISYRILNSNESAKEVVQEFFVKLWLKREEINVQYSFKSYAYRSVYNASLNLLRDSRRFIGITEASHIADVYEHKVEGLDDDLVVKEALESLPPQCRKVFTIVCIEGFSYADAAEKLGISVNTVKVQMSKAYRMLRSTLTIQSVMYLVVQMVG